MDNPPYSFLRKLPLFAELPEADLDELCQGVEEVKLKQGEVLFTEGSVGHYAYVIKEGKLEVYKSSNGQQVHLDVRQEGDVIGEIALLESTTRTASVRAMVDSLLLAISDGQLDKLINSNPSIARILLHTIAARLRTSELMMRQSEKMAQLGTLSAGIAHELNNPAAAVRRGSEQLHSAFKTLQQVQFQISEYAFTPAQLNRLLQLGDQARAWVSTPVELDALERSDREALIEEKLNHLGIENAWELAPVLVGLGFDGERIDSIAPDFPPASLRAVMTWLVTTASIHSLMEEVGQGATRISEIVKALKSYTYLDQAPVQEVDVHEGLNNTLVMLRHKLKLGVEVRREYDQNLPHIQAYGSELNQVWTNLIDNAIDAMQGNGRILIQTTYQDPWVTVSIEDNGPGIPEEIQPKLFSPFFTTKPVGKGTGLGLNITYNIVHKHNGSIKVFSHPGLTRFEVCLPLDLREAKGGKGAQAAVQQPDDATLRHIYESVHTIAVVGISDKPDRPAHSVPAYLQKLGYRIIPVNPNLTEVLGEKAYPDLLSVPDPVDVVEIFRASENVPPVVDQAIQIGAKVIWMQEGISNESAAHKARQAGLQVVSNICMRATHLRLYGHKKS